MCVDSINSKNLYVELTAIIAISVKMIYGFNDKQSVVNSTIDLTCKESSDPEITALLKVMKALSELPKEQTVL